MKRVIKFLRHLLKDYGMFGWNYWHLFCNPWIIPVEIYKYTKWFIQRGRRGYSDQDGWDLSSYLLSWLPDAIAGLRKTKHGYPVGMTARRWHEVLVKMEAGLRAAKTLAELGCPVEPYQKKAAQGLDLFRKYFWDLWD